MAYFPLFFSSSIATAFSIRPINLFLCSSVYQLLNALNLRVNVFGSDAADIVVTDICPDHEGIAERLRASGLFDTVYAKRKLLIALYDTLPFGFAADNRLKF